VLFIVCEKCLENNLFGFVLFRFVCLVWHDIKRHHQKQVFVGIALLLGASAEEKTKEEKKPAEAEASKKQDKRGLFDHDFGQHDFGGQHEFAHSYSSQDFGHGGHEVVHHHEPQIVHHGGHHEHHEPIHHHHGHHEEKTLTIIKKIPVPVPQYKTVHVPHIKEVHVPYEVKVAKPYPVVKHVSSLLVSLPERLMTLVRPN